MSTMLGMVSTCYAGTLVGKFAPHAKTFGIRRALRAIIRRALRAITLGIARRFIESGIVHGYTVFGIVRDGSVLCNGFVHLMII